MAALSATVPNLVQSLKPILMTGCLPVALRGKKSDQVSIFNIFLSGLRFVPENGCDPDRPKKSAAAAFCTNQFILRSTAEPTAASSPLN